jgi:hypothetical protein
MKFEAIEPTDGCFANRCHAFEHFVPLDAFIMTNRYFCGIHYFPPVFSPEFISSRFLKRIFLRND